MEPSCNPPEPPKDQMTTPSKSDFKKFWSVFEAEQQRRKKNKTIPPSNYDTDKDQK